MGEGKLNQDALKCIRWKGKDYVSFDELIRWLKAINKDGDFDSIIDSLSQRIMTDSKSMHHAKEKDH